MKRTLVLNVREAYFAFAFRWNTVEHVGLSLLSLLLPIIMFADTVCRHGVNLLQDFLGPLNARFYQSVGSRAPLWASEQVISRSHVKAGEDRSHNPDHTFVALVHRQAS